MGEKGERRESMQIKQNRKGRGIGRKGNGKKVKKRRGERKDRRSGGGGEEKKRGKEEEGRKTGERQQKGWVNWAKGKRKGKERGLLPDHNNSESMSFRGNKASSS